MAGSQDGTVADRYLEATLTRAIMFGGPLVVYRFQDWQPQWSASGPRNPRDRFRKAGNTAILRYMVQHGLAYYSSEHGDCLLTDQGLERAQKILDSY